MSTYTDLHNKIKENVVVNYHDRCTPQEVRFLNENNEYWGTFTGTANIQHLEANSAKLSNTLIVGSTLSNCTIGDLDVSTLPGMMEELSSTLDEVKDIPETVNKAIEDVNAEVEAQGEIVARISANVLDGVENLSSIVEMLSTDLDETTSGIITSFDDVYDALSSETVARIQADESIRDDLTEQINDRVSELSANVYEDLAKETADRIKGDETIVDSAVEAAIYEINEQKHYQFLTDEENNQANYDYPHKTFDYKINKIVTPVYDYYLRTTEFETVAGVVELTDGSIVIDTFGTKGTSVEDCTVPYNRSIMKADEKTVPTGAGSYVYTKNDDGSISITSDTTNTYHQIYAQDKDNKSNKVFLGLVKNAELDDNGQFLSGQVYGTMRPYAGKINGAELDNAETSSYFVDDVQVDYRLITEGSGATANAFDFFGDIETKKSINLCDDESSEQFGTIYDKFGSIDGIRKTEDGTISAITIELYEDGIAGDTVELNKDNGFKDYAKDFEYLSANIDEKKIIHVSENNTYSYIAVGTQIDQDGALIESRIIVKPTASNKNILEEALLVADTISVDLSDTIKHKTFSKVFVLNKVQSSEFEYGKWEASESVYYDSTHIQSDITLTIEDTNLYISITNIDTDDDTSTTVKIKSVIGSDGILQNGDKQETVIHSCTLENFEFNDVVKVINRQDSGILAETSSASSSTFNVSLIKVVNYDNAIVVAVPDPVNGVARNAMIQAQEFALLIKPEVFENAVKQYEVCEIKVQTKTPGGGYIDAKLINDRAYEIYVAPNVWSTFHVTQIDYNEEYGEPIYMFDDLDETQIYNTMDANYHVLDTKIDDVHTEISGDIEQLSADVSNSLSGFEVSSFTSNATTLSDLVVSYNKLVNALGAIFSLSVTNIANQ